MWMLMIEARFVAKFGHACSYDSVAEGCGKDEKSKNSMSN